MLWHLCVRPKVETTICSCCDASAGIVIGKFEELNYTQDAHEIYFIRLQDEMKMFKALLVNS